jgi:hypothetical protein
MKALALLVCVSFSGLAFAQAPTQDALERFNALPEAKKQELREKMKAF